MRRAGSRLVYFARTALRGLAGSPVTSAVAVVTIGVSLVLVGAFALLLRNMEELLDALRRRSARDGLSRGRDLARRERRELLEDRVAPSKGSSTCASSRRRRRSSASAPVWGAAPPCSRGSTRIRCRPRSRSPCCRSDVRRRACASWWSRSRGSPASTISPRGRTGWRATCARSRWCAAWGSASASILALATLLIVANTIRLAVFARRDELEILSLVGASRSFVSTPFLLEGIARRARSAARSHWRCCSRSSDWCCRASSSGSSWCWEASRRASSRGAEALGLVAGGAGLGLLGSAAALAGGWRA